VKIERPDDRQATVTFGRKTVPTADFRLLYDTAKGPLRRQRVELPARHKTRMATSCCWPARKIKAEQAERTAKTVMFVVDRSGSMSGKKMEQAREAARFVLNNLREGDTVQHRGVRQPHRGRSARNCNVTTRRLGKRPWDSSRACTPAEPRTSTGR
jgi:hypothetical protein